MGAKTKVVDTTPKDIRSLRANAVNWLQGAQAPSMGSYFQGAQGAQGEGRPATPQFGMAGESATPQGFNGLNESRSSGFSPGQLDQAAYPPTGGMNTMFSQLPNAPGRVDVQQTPMIGPLGQINPQTIGQFQNPLVQMISQSAIPQVSGPGGNIPQVSGIPQVMGTNPVTGMRGDIRDVNGLNIGQQNTQSVDQLGGMNSAFFQNMMSQLSPAFQQQRAEALAQAKEGLGTMGRGSALANTLGTAMNRSLGDQQAMLANYATQGMGMETNRQMGLAGLNNQANMANQQNNMQAQQANQQADVQFLNQLLSGSSQGLQGQMANAGNQLTAQQANQGAWLQGQNLGQQAQAQNQDAWMRAAQANQGAGLQSGIAGLDANLRAQQANQATNLAGQQSNVANDFQRQAANQNTMQGTNALQANLDWNRLSQMFGLQGQMGMQNANNYAQILQAMMTQGVAPGQVVQSGGAGAVLGPLAGIAGTALGGPLGGMIGSKLFGGGGK